MSSLIPSTCCRRLLSSTLSRRVVLGSPTMTRLVFPLSQHHHQQQAQVQLRTLSSTTTTTTTTTRQERKNAAKEVRRHRYEQKTERRDSLATRREDRPRRGQLKAAFDAWFQKRRAFQERHDRLARQQKRDFLIRVACIVERLPVVTPDWEDWELAFDELQARCSHEYGRRYPADTPFGRVAERDPDDYEVDDDSYGGSSGSGGRPPPMTNEEVLARLPAHLREQMTSRTTEADRTNDVRSLDRCLPQRLFLTTTPVPVAGMVFPTVTLGPDETMVRAAQRAASEAVGDDLDLWNAGNCPMAVDMKVYREGHTHQNDQEDYEDLKRKYYGEKTFYIRVQRMDGDVHLGKGVDDYAWLTSEEIVDKLNKEVGESSAKLHHYLL